MARIITLKDKDDVPLYPQTTVDALYDMDGNSLEGYNSRLPERITQDPNDTFTTGAVKTDGTIDTTLTDYVYCAPIELKPGDIIRLNRGNDLWRGANIAMVYACNESGVYVLTLVAGDGTSGRVSYTNETANTIYVGVCMYNAVRHYYIVEKDVAEGVLTAIRDYVLSESFTVRSSVVRDSNGNVTSANIIYPDGVLGTMSITRDSEGNATQVVYTYSGTPTRTYTITVTRNSDGDVVTTALAES